MRKVLISSFEVVPKLTTIGQTLIASTNNTVEAISQNENVVNQIL